MNFFCTHSIANRIPKVDEVSAANFFVVLPDEIRTPKLGTILEGCTRDAVLQFLALYPQLTKGRRVVVGDVRREHLERATEAFCCGTAASVTLIGGIEDPGDESFRRRGGPVSRRTFQSAQRT